MVANRACIVRLSTYKNALKRLKALGFKKVFSDNLGDAAGVSPAQVRKDFSLFGVTGNKRAGYQVDDLIDQLGEVLGKNEIHKLVIVGAGRIGVALLRYKGFTVGGIEVAAAFDIDPAKFDQKSDIPILPLEELCSYVQENNIKIGILAVPDMSAQQVAELMISAGIKGILNFAPIQLRGGEDVVVNNINLELEIENLIYFVSAGHKVKKI
ncbi:MAG: redox-sensing transcriptional repressor Rex [Sedimentisphaerales bacterium]|nr:redox-sensing transcriptional repressor Rex [Sedimentisphaerales bacterium]